MEAVQNRIETLQRVGRGTHHRLVRGTRQAVAVSRQGPKPLETGAAVGSKPEHQLGMTMIQSKGVRI
jgi:hypothetical protein